MAGFNKPIIERNDNVVTIYDKDYNPYGQFTSSGFSFNDGDEIYNSTDVETFPSHLLEDNPFESVQTITLRVKKGVNAENPDGKTWETAFDEIQDALDYVPLNLRGHIVYIFVHGGNYSPFLVEHHDGQITFMWVGTFVNTETDEKNSYIRGSSVNPIDNNDPITITTTDDTSAVRLWGGTGNLTVCFHAQNENIPWNQPNSWYWGRWKVVANGTTSNPYILFDANFRYNTCHLYADIGLTVDMGNTGNWWGLGFAVGNCDGNLRGIELIGGDGDASTKSSAWSGAIGLIRENVGFHFFEDAGEQWATGYEPPDGKLAWFSDIKNVYTTWYRTGGDMSSFYIRLENGKSIYKDVNYTYGKGAIQLTAGQGGTIKYTPTYFDLTDNSTTTRTIINDDTGETTVYISGDAGRIDGTLAVPQIQLDALSSAPSGQEGMIYYDSGTKHFYGYDGSSWKQLDN